MTNHANNQSLIPSTDVIQLTLTLKMTTGQVVETSVTVNNNSPIEGYVHLDDQTQPTYLELSCVVTTIYTIYVSEKLPAYPSPKPTFCPKGGVSVNVGLGKG